MKDLKYKRVLLKLSGEVLEGEKGAGIDFEVLNNLCSEVIEVQKLGVEIAIVVGGGNFWRYRDFKDSGLSRVKSDSMGMLATIMNAIAMSDVFNRLGVKSKVFSTVSVSGVADKLDSSKGIDFLSKENGIVVCAGGTGSPFFTTDTAASLRALELECDVVLKATKVDYVYDKDPNKFDDAKSYKKISYSDVLNQGLQVMDLSAVSMCMDNDMPLVVFNLTKKGNIAKVVKGEDVGTIIY